VICIRQASRFFCAHDYYTDNVLTFGSGRSYRIYNAISLATGGVNSSVPVSVNAKIINQLGNSVDTTQGIDMTKRLVAIA